MNRLLLSQVHIAQIESEARAAFPHECCGLIEGKRDGATTHVAAFHSTRNIAIDADRFAIDPAAHFRLQRAAREEGRQIVGCYHSHPNGKAELSPRDREGAMEQNFIWLIAALCDTGPVALNAYALSDRMWQACSIERL